MNFIPEELKSVPLITDGIPDRNCLNKIGLNFWQASRLTSLELGMRLAPNKVWAQFGVSNGESALWMEGGAEELYLFDSFQGLPEDWSSKFPKGHFATTVPKFSSSKVKVVEGWFEDTVLDYALHRFGLVHMDADLYSSTKFVLETINVFKGQVFVFDEMFGTQECLDNEWRAFQEWREDYDILVEFIGRTPYSQVVLKIV